MSEIILIIGNKNYSSWSLRPWLALKHTGHPFKEIRIPIHQENSLKEILKYSPSGRVPCLIDGDIKVWESLAERFPEAKLWPADAKAHALARAISNEMHGGFMALRKNLPVNIRERISKNIPSDVQEDIDCITAIWKDCRTNYGKSGSLLFGNFSIADAMFAPVVTRFVTYGVKVDSVSEAYMKAILFLPAMQEWIKAASLEKEMIAH